MLLSFLERWKNVLDKKGYGGAVLMDLSKAFDTLNHDLLIAKLHAYGFSEESLQLINSYLTNRWQRSMRVLVIGLNFYKDYHKGLFLGRYSLIYIYMH